MSNIVNDLDTSYKDFSKGPPKELMGGRQKYRKKNFGALIPMFDLVAKHVGLPLHQKIEIRYAEGHSCTCRLYELLSLMSVGELIACLQVSPNCAFDLLLEYLEMDWFSNKRVLQASNFPVGDVSKDLTHKSVADQDKRSFKLRVIK